MDGERKMTAETQLPAETSILTTEARETNLSRWLKPACALLIIAFAYFYRLDTPPFWGDEADTGIGARSILRCGYPMAFDGRNVCVFKNGEQLNRKLIFQKIPWLQYYVGAVSLTVFGNNTAGLRILFAVCGMLAFFPVHAVLKLRVKQPAIFAVLILLAPQVILFQRNARYYPLLILFYAVLIWLVSSESTRSGVRLALATVLFVLFFHTHPLAALCAAVALIGHCLMFRRPAVMVYAIAGAIGFTSWLIWHRMLGPPLAETKLFLPGDGVTFADWLRSFYTGLWATVVDMDAAGCFPILFLGLICAGLYFWKRAALVNLLRDGCCGYVWLTLIIQTTVMAICFGSEGTAYNSVTRYSPHLLVFGLVTMVMAVHSVFRNQWICLTVCVLAIASNLFTFSYWTNPLGRQVPSSWALPVYSEIFRPKENPWSLLIKRLQDEADRSSPDPVMVVFPEWNQELAIFYLGEQFIIRPVLQPPADQCEQAMREVMDVKSRQRIARTPDWIVDVLGDLESIPESYEPAGLIPAQLSRPDEGNRPELTRHSFAQPSVVRNMRLFRLQKNSTTNALPD